MVTSQESRSSLIAGYINNAAGGALIAVASTNVFVGGCDFLFNHAAGGVLVNNAQLDVAVAVSGALFGSATHYFDRKNKNPNDQTPVLGR